MIDPDLRARSDAEREDLIDLLGARTAIFNREARQVGLVWPRFERGFFVSVFTPDPEVTGATMRDMGVYVISVNGAVRVALFSTPATVLLVRVDGLAAG